MSNPSGSKPVTELKAILVQDSHVLLSWEYDGEYEFVVSKQKGLGKEYIGTTTDTHFAIKLSDIDYSGEVTTVFYVTTNAENGVSIQLPIREYVDFNAAKFYAVDRDEKFVCDDADGVLTKGSISSTKWRKV